MSEKDTSRNRMNLNDMARTIADTLLAVRGSSVQRENDGDTQPFHGCVRIVSLVILCVALNMADEAQPTARHTCWSSALYKRAHFIRSRLPQRKTLQKRRFSIHHIMPRITTAHLATIFLLTCLTAQVVSQTTSSANSTLSPMSNQTVNTYNGTMATSTYVGPMNTTTAPAGTAYQSQSCALFVVISGTIATMLVHYCC
ncbi:hypothetical protein SRHO_G00006260 [Serrasalmus rhombeus]